VLIDAGQGVGGGEELAVPFADAYALEGEQRMLSSRASGRLAMPVVRKVGRDQSSPLRGGSRPATDVDSPARARARVDLAGRTGRPDPRSTLPVSTELTGIVAEHIAAVNAFDTERIVATFAPDAYVNDNRREIWGTDAIRAFMAKEFVGDHVTMDVREVIDHYGDIIVRARYDGTYDKANLPDELIMTSYFGIRDNRIVSLAVIFNQPSPY
jgi:hypothetical protein